MLLYKDIVRDGHEVLKMNANDVTLPLSSEDENTIIAMNEYLLNGYDEEFLNSHDIRPGVGIAAPQIGLAKKMFCIASFDEKGDFHNYCIINPKIVSHSEELTYLESGEGCLSVNESYKGLIHRYKRIKARVTLYDYQTGETKETYLQLKGYLSIVFQHEYDHLFGKLFYERINKQNPFFVPSNSKPVVFNIEE